MPDLVARMAALHQTMTARLALQESLLSLSGRLEMVLAQIEMRAAVAPAPLAVPKAVGAAKGKDGEKGKKVARYVEGESEEEEEGMEVEVEVGSADEGSVEDVELGAEEDDDESEEDEEEDDGDDDDEEEEEDDESDDGELRVNGFIDDEAEEYSEDEEEEESE
jgi:U3 small nucleolar RNA-associated protein 5